MLKDKTIWITGGTSGIGAACAKNLADKAKSIIISGKHTEAEYMESGKDILSDKYDNIRYLQADISSKTSIETAYERVSSEMGGIDILLNNAGVNVFGPFQNLSYDEMNNMTHINMTGLMLLTQKVLENMLSQKDGIIINILSVAVIKVFKYSGVYSATKAAVSAWSKALREEVRTEGVKIVDIFPGATATDIWNPSALEKMGERMAKPEDIAEVVASALELSMNRRIMIEEIVVRPQFGDL